MNVPELPVAAAVGASVLGPLGLAAGQVPLPSGVPWWAAIVASVVGPGVSAAFWFVGKSVVKAFAASIRAKGQERRRLAQLALADKDPKNDAPAREEALRAAGELAVADSLDRAVGLAEDVTSPGFKKPRE